MESEKNPPSDVQSSGMPVEGDQKKHNMCYSGFWVRWAARMIDCVIIVIIMIIVFVPFFLSVGLLSAIPGMGIFAQFFGMFFGLIIGWSYYIILTHKYQATVGKILVGAQVVAEDGKKLSLEHLILRETIGKFVSGLILCIGYLMAAFTSKKQGLHDYIARSVVVYKDPIRGPRKFVVVTVYIIAGLSMIVMIALTVFFFFLFGTLITNDVNWGGTIDDTVSPNFEEDYNFEIEDVENFLQKFNDKPVDDVQNYTIEQS